MNSYNKAYISLGSNLNNPLAQINRACKSLSKLRQVSRFICSPLYRSKAVGPGVQPDYINAVASLETTLSPFALLKMLHAIEDQQGRQRHTYWGARTLDLDLLLYGDICIDTDVLQLPHTFMYERNFVLFPLYDIAKDLVLPNGVPLSEQKASLSSSGLKKLEQQPGFIANESRQPSFQVFS